MISLEAGCLAALGAERLRDATLKWLHHATVTVRRAGKHPFPGHACYWRQMLGSEYDFQNCSVARTLELIGERWSLLIIRDLLSGDCRFSDLERSLGIAKNILAVRLSKLAGVGILEKVDSHGSTSTYRLTSKGRDLFPVIAALMLWGDVYLAPDGPPIRMRHCCGADYSHALTCAACGETLDALSVHAIPGPGGSKQPTKNL